VVVGVHPREREEAEAPAVLRRGEADVAQVGREARRRPDVPRPVLEDHVVDLLDRVDDLVVGVGGRQLELEDEPVDLVEN